MRRETESTEAKRQYAVAYDAHYSKHDLSSAMWLYRQVMVSHPSDPEAEYALVQIQNIVKAVVPERDLLDAQMELALTRFERTGDEPCDRESSSRHAEVFISQHNQ